MPLGMDWLYIHKTKVDCYDKAIECLDDDERIILEGVVAATTTLQNFAYASILEPSLLSTM